MQIDPEVSREQLALIVTWLGAQIGNGPAWLLVPQNVQDAMKYWTAIGSNLTNNVSAWDTMITQANIILGD